MKALTVRQPWAWAILHGGKDVENRSRRTNHRGPLLIHAGATYDNAAITGPHFRQLVEAQVPEGAPWAWAIDLLVKPKAQIVGVADVFGCHRSDDCMAACSPWAMHAVEDGADTPLLWHWELANPRAFAEPIPCKGRLGLWTPPADVLAQIEAMSA